jgi:hypothetical protein
VCRVFETPFDAVPEVSLVPREGSIPRYLTFVGLALVGLMVTLEPDVGFTAPPGARLLFWFLQIATGLFVLQSVLYLMTRRLGAGRMPNWSLVLLSGVFGAMVLAPVYWLIGEGLMQGWLGYPAPSEEAEAHPFGLNFTHPLMREYADIVGPITAAWALICLPRLHWLVPPTLHERPQASEAAPPSSGGLTTAADTEEPPAQYPDTASGGTPSVAPDAPSRGSWRERLPAELGQDVIAVSSELQYLRVWTTRGCALILGALADVEREEASRGLRVHRSWWVACDHVLSVRRTATGAVCMMSDGPPVPVSRRRRAEVLSRFGDGAQYRPVGNSEQVTQTDLH